MEFCSRVLSSEGDIVNHYEQEYKIPRKNSLVFESYVDSLQSDPLEFFVNKRNYCNGFFFDNQSRSIYILKTYLKILNTAELDHMIFRTIGIDLVLIVSFLQRFRILQCKKN